MSYRPITDTWILARAKLKPNADGSPRKYYGAYLGGFPERARILLGVTLTDPVLHVCGGMAKFYPYPRGFGVNDKTVDLDPKCEPDFIGDVREPLPALCFGYLPNGTCVPTNGEAPNEIYPPILWPAILCDPPYSEPDAVHYLPGSEKYPNPNALVRNCVNSVRVGGRVGFLHYLWPGLPKNAMEVAIIAVKCGRNGRARQLTVLERLE